MSSTPRPVIGIFGAGKVGIAIARLALAAGCTVRIASSGSASDTETVTHFFAPTAEPADSHDLPGLADILLIAVPCDASTSSRSPQWATTPSSTS